MVKVDIVYMSSKLGAGLSGVFFLSLHTDWLWGPPSLLLNGYWMLFPQGSGWSVKLTTHLHLAQRLRTSGAIPPLPMYLCDVVFNEAQDTSSWCCA